MADRQLGRTSPRVHAIWYASRFLTPDFWRETRNENPEQNSRRRSKGVVSVRSPPGSEAKSTAVRPHKKQDREKNNIRKAFDFDRNPLISIIEVETSASIASQTHFRHITHSPKKTSRESSLTIEKQSAKQRSLIRRQETSYFTGHQDSIGTHRLWDHTHRSERICRQ